MNEVTERAYGTVTLEVSRGAGLLTICRPQQLNALNAAVLADLSVALDAAAADPDIRVLVVTGQGSKAFAAGADIAEMEGLDPDGASSFSRVGKSVFAKIENCPKPVIAAVNGYALGGGCELALSCDIRIAGKNARLGQPEVGLGIIPGFGGTQRLARLVGKAAAMEVILSGRIITADEALSMGLVNRVVAEGDAVNEALSFASEIVKKSPYAVSQAKKAVLCGLSLSLEDGLCLEERLFAKCFGYSDQKEGMRAFLEKRKAEF